MSGARLRGIGSRLAVLAAAAACFGLPFALDDFQTVLLGEIMIWGLFAMGFDLIYGYLGLLSFGQSMFFGAGAYAVAFALIIAKTNVWAAVGLAVIVAAAFAAVTGLLVVRATHHYFMILTIIFSLVVTLILQSGHWRWLTGGYGGRTFTVPTLPLGPWEVSLGSPLSNYYFILSLVGAAFFICRRMLASPLGKVFLSIRENEERARLVGYNVERYKLIAFVIAGAVSGLAGGLYAITFRYTNLIFFHWTTSGEAIVSTVVGGAGTLIGAYLGAGFLLVFKDYLSSWIENANILIGILLVLVVRVAPVGFVGVLRGYWGRHAG
jgi:branched-chain amino acid transport system permease protein